MLGDVEVQNASTAMTDDKEAIEHTESNRWYGEEIHRRDGFPVIAKKDDPPLSWLWISRCAFHPAGDRSLAYIESQHQKFSVDARCTPSRILGHYSEDQLTHMLRSLLASD